MNGEAGSFVTTSDGVPLYYESRGPSTGDANAPTVVLIHGWSGSSQVFLRNFEALSRDFRVVRYDQRAHGESGRSEHGLRVARLAKDLWDLMGALSLHGSKTVLVGCSLGAAVIWQYVELFGAAGLAGAVFVDQSPYQEYAFDGSWVLGSNGLFSNSALAAFCTTLLHSPDAVHRGTVDACLTRPPTDAEVTFFTTEAKKAHPLDLAEIMKDHNKNDWRASAPLVTCPTLVVVGDKSKIFPPEGPKFMATAMPKARVVAFENGSHWLYYEEAERFNDEILRFVDGLVDG